MTQRKIIFLEGKKFLHQFRYNDLEPYNLYGMTDCMELHENKNGISINGSEKKYQIVVVEYKPTKPKKQEYREDDLMQVFAQKLCIDFVFGGQL